MARPLYPHEIGDPDFFWLISSFRENNSKYVLIEVPNLPVVFIGEGKPQEEELNTPMANCEEDSNDVEDMSGI